MTNVLHTSQVIYYVGKITSQDLDENGNGNVQCR